MYSQDDTIVAISSPPGGAARGIVRLSGPRVQETLVVCFRAGQADGDNPPTDALDVAPSLPTSISRPSSMAGSLNLPGIASPLPCQLYLWPDGRSYTGGPVAEIHTFGSQPLLEAVVAALCEAGARLAQPGEFTLRAFLAGRIDLSRAEAVLGVIDAVAPEQLRVALAQLAGGLAGPLDRLRDTLVGLLAEIEAGLDFADEDLDEMAPEEQTRLLDEAAELLTELARQMTSRSVTGSTVRAVLVGRPNVGKSSLFNALARRHAALVAQQPGTTRDYLTAELDLDGIKCQLIDTAGMGLDDAVLRDQVAQAAQTVSAEQHLRAHVQILCLDCTRPLDRWELDQLEQAPAEGCIIVQTKIDLGSAERATKSVRNFVSANGQKWGVPETESIGYDRLRRAVQTSSKTGLGIELLRDELRDAVLAAAASGTEVVASTAVRCRESIHRAAVSLDRARGIARSRSGEELVAAEIHMALGELGKVVGTVYTDDILDQIFSRFCIGK